MKRTATLAALLSLFMIARPASAVTPPGYGLWWNYYTTGSVTGYLKLVTPILATEGNIFQINLTGYLYGPAAEIHCNGYANYPSGLINTDCIVSGMTVPVAVTTELRPGKTTPQVVIVMGTPTTSWYLPHFALDYKGWIAHNASEFDWVYETTPATPPQPNLNKMALNALTLGAPITADAWPSPVNVRGSVSANSHVTHTPWWRIGSSTGYVKLVTPIVADEGNMFLLRVNGYLYGATVDIQCGGYAQSGGGLQNSDCSVSGTDIPVDLAAESRSGSNVIVLRLGTPSTNWAFPNLTMEYVGWKAKDAAGFQWVSGETFPTATRNLNVFEVRTWNGGTVRIGSATEPNLSTTRLTVNGSVVVTGNIGAKYQDVAEWVPASGAMEAGTVVVLNEGASNEVIASYSAYATTVAGVVSPQPGIILGEGGPSKQKIATTGRVKVRVDATQKPIRVGDLLVTSAKSGRAMRSEATEMNGRKFHQPGTIIGKALEPLDGGEGEILVLLSLQ